MDFDDKMCEESESIQKPERLTPLREVRASLSEQIEH